MSTHAMMENVMTAMRRFERNARCASKEWCVKSQRCVETTSPHRTVSMDSGQSQVVVCHVTMTRPVKSAVNPMHKVTSVHEMAIVYSYTYTDGEELQEIVRI